MNKKYELALIFKPDLSEEIFNNEMENIKNMIDKSGAVIEKIDAWGKKKISI
jgi:small subunit ribosomal protein S6